MKSSPLAGPGRRRTALGVLAGLLAPAAVLAAAPPVAALPDGSPGPGGPAPVSAASSAAAEGTVDRYIFGSSGLSPDTCNPVLAVSTTEGQVNLLPEDTGWYRSDGSHNPSNANYIVGTAETFGVFYDYRDFFVFDTTGLAGTVTSARLDVTQSGGCSNGIGEPSTFWLNDVSTPVAELAVRHDGDDAGRAVYADLRAGEFYGRSRIADPNANVSVDLSPAGVEAVDAADGLFAVGGSYREPVADTTLVADPAQGDGVGNDGVTLTVTVAGETGADGRGMPTGTVDFAQDESAIADCAGVALEPGVGEKATATCVVPELRPGQYDFAAVYSGDEQYGAGQAGRLDYDARAIPDVSVGLEDDTDGVVRTEVVTLTTEVTGVEGESAPSGVVGFDVDGEPVDGCQDVALTKVVGTVSARATCETSFEETGEHAVTTRYDGDGTYRAGVDGPLAVDVLSDAPTITAAVTSSDEPSATGWFQAPATVTFTCESFHGLDSSGCPEPVTVGSNGRAELERTITDGEGQQASTSVVVKVDKRAPRVVVRHVRDGATYDRMRQARCTAFDRHSRVAGDCETETQVVRQFRDGRREVAFTATAMDRADNVKQKSGTFFVR